MLDEISVSVCVWGLWNFFSKNGGVTNLIYKTAGTGENEKNSCRLAFNCQINQYFDFENFLIEK